MNLLQWLNGFFGVRIDAACQNAEQFGERHADELSSAYLRGFERKIGEQFGDCFNRMMSVDVVRIDNQPLLISHATPANVKRNRK